MEYDSDLDSDYEEANSPKSPNASLNIHIQLTDKNYDEWQRIPAALKKEAGHRLKLCVFWDPILLRNSELRDISTTAHWAYHIGLLDKEDPDGITLKHLQRIEVVEAVVTAVEKGILRKDQIRQAIFISNKLNMRVVEAMEDALSWLERTGEPAIRRRVQEFGLTYVCFMVLHHIFSEFAQYIQQMAVDVERTLRGLRTRPEHLVLEKSEAMKRRGNENFQKSQFEDALRFYSQAIKLYPENHLIYGNRALCYIRCKRYLKAVVDGKRAMLIDPLWAKGHYRYCEALFLLGERRLALEANKRAMSACGGDQEGLRDLRQQHDKFLKDMAEARAPKTKESQSSRSQSVSRSDAGRSQSVSRSDAGKSQSVSRSDAGKSQSVSRSDAGRSQSVSRSDAGKSRTQSPKTTKKTNPAAAAQSKMTAGKMETQTQPVKKEKPPPPAAATAAVTAAATAAVTAAAAAAATAAAKEPKKKPKSRNCVSEPEQVATASSRADVLNQLRSLVQDAHVALSDLRSHNAEQAFSQALTLLDDNTATDLGLSSLDVQLLMFGRASALTGVNQPEELSEARRLLEKIQALEERTFQCVVYYAMGRVYLRENRFALALQHFSDSLQMVQRQITPGKLTWPLTKEVVKETQPDYFRDVLDEAIESCKHPPAPDAICRIKKCLGPNKAEIYFTDPDFKGFIRILCSQSCVVDYHMHCWKTLKATAFPDKTEKELLHAACLTPDCFGQICNIQIFGPTGLPKCKFAAPVSKPQTPKKPKVNQKCSSQKKVKAKQERRLRRKEHQQAGREPTAGEDGDKEQPGDAADAQSPHKAWQLYRDRVLLQISQNLELLQAERGLKQSALCVGLQPWLELDCARGNQLARRLLDWPWEPPAGLGPALQLLLERNNRVWARVLVHVLSDCRNINPKLSSWAGRLDDAGLSAAKSFIERNTEHLEQLDLALLLGFGPLQNLIMEKLGAAPDFFSPDGLTVTEYLKQAPPHHTRIFIWTLEEHRDSFVSCHAILDEYFDMMDGYCSVLKKSDENQNNSPMKSKKKKKHKEPKGSSVLCLGGNLSHRDEWDQEILDDDSLSFLQPDDPFTVPPHLRDQVADFEEHFSGNRRDFKHFLDNSSDSTKESLYDYFAQILEEYGPLEAQDPLMVGQLENFPPEAKQRIQESGGLEPFLLDSLRFISLGHHIGLAQHAAAMQSPTPHPDHFDPLMTSSPPDPFLVYYGPGSPDLYLAEDAELVPSLPPPLPNPYVIDRRHYKSPGGGAFAGAVLYPKWSNGEDAGSCAQPLQFGFGPDQVPELSNAVPSDENHTFFGITSECLEDENGARRGAGTQTCQEMMRSVTVNTEPHPVFESYPGDINKKVKSNMTMKNLACKMAGGGDGPDTTHEDVAALEYDIQKINTNIQVTNKELALFQQKLEEEVKKDQAEKKSNQELLKSLKVEIDALAGEQASLTQSIREKKATFDEKQSDFLELSSQQAAEKMSLEDEIRRRAASLASAKRRSQTAQLSMVESSKDQDLFSLYRELADAKALLGKVDEAMHRCPSRDLEVTRRSCRTKVQELEKKIAKTEALHKEHANQVKNGRRFNELLPVADQPEAAAPATVAEAPPTPAQHKPAARPSEPAHATVFERAIGSLAAMFPDYSRSDLMRFVRDLRSSSGGNLSSMSLEDLVGGATQLILDHQEKLAAAAKSKSAGRSNQATPPLVTPVWQQLVPQRASHIDALNMEDPCIICYEVMNPEDICVLECRHSFHRECIKSWLKEQSTCPTCREHALLPDDFPMLPGRRRQVS